MPTLRLGDSERRSIFEDFTEVIDRAIYNKTFPIDSDDMEEFGFSLLHIPIRDAYKYLLENMDTLVRQSTYSTYFRIYNSNKSYKIIVKYCKMPCDYLTVPEEHPYHEVIMEWAAQHYSIEKEMVLSKKYLQTIISSCSSIGQVKRVLPADILRFVPDHLVKYFADAERKSRIPRGFIPDPFEMNRLANMLTLGTLSPEKQSGLEASVVSEENVD